MQVEVNNYGSIKYQVRVQLVISTCTNRKLFFGWGRLAENDVAGVVWSANDLADPFANNGEIEDISIVTQVVSFCCVFLC